MVQFERVLAGLIAVACVLLLVRLLLGARHRQRVDQTLWRWWRNTRRAALALWHWRDSRKAAAHAKQVAKQAIERARHRVDKKGNVYTPEAFKEPRKPD
jgi:hypothetical protein